MTQVQQNFSTHLSSTSDGRRAGNPRAWPPRLNRMGFGGDYNAEQWSPQVWDEDIRLMSEAGVTAATVGVFSWVMLQPTARTWDFEWLDQVIERLHGAGIALILATPSAVPPAWLVTAHPEILPITRSGVRLGPGAREAFCPSSSLFRDACGVMAAELAQRYGQHPALALWHVGNEFGAHVGACYCSESAKAFRLWLADRYGDLSAVNQAWGTAFWGQRYGAWNEIQPPRDAPMPVNPAQQLDFFRFSSDEYLACYVAEREILRAVTPDIPITTNFMANNCKNLDYWKWAPEVDVIANDHYLIGEDPASYVDLAMSADLTRSLGGGAPWLLMEHSTSAVNWQPRNLAKQPGEMRRNSLSHIAHGADATLFFQWRTSRYGAEKFHSAMLSQSGGASRRWPELVGLGADVAALAQVQGSRVLAQVALMWDWQSWWALELEFRPSQDVAYLERMRAFYEAVWRTSRTVDFVAPEAELSAYQLVVLPSSYLLTRAAAENIRRYVEAGGTVLVSFFSGIVDETETVYDGSYPGALRDVLGLWIDEFHPLAADAVIDIATVGAVSSWSEAVVLEGAESVYEFTDGPDQGGPAVTRRSLGRGHAWYLASKLDTAQLVDILEEVCVDAGLPRRAVQPDVEIVRRVGTDAEFTFVINHSSEAVLIPSGGLDLLRGRYHDSEIRLDGGDVAVLRTEI